MSAAEVGGVSVDDMSALLTDIETGAKVMEPDELAALIKLLRNAAQNSHNKGFRGGAGETGFSSGPQGVYSNIRQDYLHWARRLELLLPQAG